MKKLLITLALFFTTLTSKAQEAFEGVWTMEVCKSMNKGPPGLKNQEIVKMLGFDHSHNKAEILLDQN